MIETGKIYLFDINIDFTSTFCHLNGETILEFINADEMFNWLKSNYTYVVDFSNRSIIIKDKKNI